MTDPSKTDLLILGAESATLVPEKATAFGNWFSGSLQMSWQQAAGMPSTQQDVNGITGSTGYTGKHKNTCYIMCG